MLRYFCPKWYAVASLPAPDVVIHPCREGDGEIIVTPPMCAKQPVKAYWNGNCASMSQSVDTLRLTHLNPGWYSVHIVDAAGVSSGVTHAFVKSIELPTINGYQVVHASSDAVRDGSVTAECAHFDASRGMFLWTNGVVTKGPVLSRVRPGKYAAIILSVADERSDCIHACAPATVDVMEHTDYC